MPKRRDWTDVSTRLYWRLLRLYPGEFRRRFGPEMTVLFKEILREALERRGPAGLALCWLRVLLDGLHSVPREWACHIKGRLRSLAESEAAMEDAMMVHSPLDLGKQPTPLVRAGVLSTMAVCWLCVVAANPAGMPLNTNSLFLVYWPYVWIGAYLALPCLLAVWLALVEQPLIVRLVQVGSVAALMGFVATLTCWCFKLRQRVDLDFLLVVFSLTAVQAFALSIVRKRLDWRLEARKVSEGRAIARIAHGLLWTAVGVGPVVLTVWMIVHRRGVAENLRRTGWLGGAVAVLLFSAVSLPLLIMGVKLILEDSRRTRISVWLGRTIFLLVVAAGLTVFVLSMVSCEWTVAHALEAARCSLAPIAFLAGYVFAVLGSLATIRFCGFRLVHSVPNVRMV